MKSENLFELEYQETLQILKQRNKSKEFEYFLNLSNDKSSHLKNDNKPCVIMFSHSFPDEIIRAFGVNPCYVFGGSFSSSKFESVYLPKDSNDQAKSILGILKSEFFGLRKKDIVLIPYSNDNYKLIESNIKDVATVIGYDVPMEKNDELSQKRFAIEIKRITHELGKHLGKHFWHFKLKKEIIKSKNASLAFSELENLYFNNECNLSLSGFVFVMNTYFMSKDKTEWTDHVKKLILDLGNKKYSENHGDFAILAGSPIYPPNYKILFELENLNVSVKKVIHKDSEYINMFKQNSHVTNLKKIANLYLCHSSEENLIENYISNEKCKGVIYHIVKGESQFDYAYHKIENKLNNSALPLIKAETVYDYEDIEQIRLRLEAFSEMIK